ncbi:MAG TPA: hypothetical protein PKM65_15430 [Spirochaetota bacterium]|nr:hypothetical protein [Spirochaetota bacterium]HNT10373.1 hypothetical protein [Spirochaetota bacterium]
MAHWIALYGRFRGSIVAQLPYLNAFYFLEIIYLMVSLNILYGNRIALAVAMALSLTVAVQMGLLFFRHPMSRYVQLGLMELHAAYSLPLCFNLATGAFEYHALDAGLIVARFFVACLEIVGIVALTDDAVRAEFE